ncbi:MAG: hypothetical protein R3Y08_05685 [Rikenellaceae bacterium]
MKTKFLFKSVLVALFATASLAWTSCSKYDDSIADLQEQIDANSDRIQANEDAISDIQALVDGGAVITNVEVTSEGVVVTLSDGNKFTVYNGEDGQDGQDGQDGTNGTNGENGSNGTNGTNGKDADVWTIGEDGYWYCNGVATEWKAVGQDGENGSNGSNGSNGTNGADGNYWTPVYDADSNSWSWVESGAEGATGNTIPMESTPAAVYSDSELTLTVDGETYVISLVVDLKTLAFIPDAIDNGMGKITVETVYGYKYNGTTPVSTFARSANFDVAYRTISKVDPTLYDWNFISRNVEMTRAAGDSEGFITINTKEDAEGNEVELITSNADNVSINAYFSDPIDWSYTNNVENGGKENIIALSAAKNDASIAQDIVSDYQVVAEEAYKNFLICDEINNISYRDFVGFDGSGEGATTAYPYNVYMSSFISTNNRIKLYFEGELNLSDIVSTWYMDLSRRIESFDVNVNYDFSVTYVTGDDNVTEQNAYVKVEKNDDGDFILSQKVYSNAGIGKEPVVYVSATYTEDDQLYFAEAYIPVVIVEEEPAIVPERPDFTYDAGSYDFIYRNLNAYSSTATYNKAITWESMSFMYDAISAGSEGGLEYTELNFTQVMFENNYDVNSITATYAGVDQTTSGLLAGTDAGSYSTGVMNTLVGNQANYPAIHVTADVTPTSLGTVGTQNAAIGYQVTNAALVGDTYVVYVEFALNNSEYNNTELPATITVSFEVEVTETVPVLSYNPNIMYTENGVDMGDCWGKYVAPTYKMQQSVKELFLNDEHLNNYVDPNNYTALDFSVVSSTDSKYVVTPASIGSDSYLTQEVLLATGKRMTNDEEYAKLQANYSLLNGQVLVGQDFVINFMNPFVIDIAQVELYHLPDDASGYNADEELVDLKVRTVKPGLDGQTDEGIVVLKNHSSSDAEAAELRFSDATYKGVNVFNYSLSSFDVDYAAAPVAIAPAVFGDNLTVGNPREFYIWPATPATNYDCAFISWTYQGGQYINDMYATEDVTITIGDDFIYNEKVSIRVNKQ